MCRINAASAKNPSAAALTNRTAPGKLNWMSFCRWWPPKSCWDPSCSPVQEMSAQSARTARSQGTRAVCHHTKGQCLSQQNLALTWRNCDYLKILGLKNSCLMTMTSATYWAFWSRGISSFCGASASSLEKTISVLMLENWMLHRHQVVFFSKFTHGWSIYTSYFFWEDFQFRAVSIVGTTSFITRPWLLCSRLKPRSGGITWRSLRCAGWVGRRWCRCQWWVIFVNHGSSWMSTKLMVSDTLDGTNMIVSNDRSRYFDVFCVVPVSVVPVGTTESQLSTQTLCYYIVT